MRSDFRRARGGFTLIELLMSLAVVGIIGVLLARLAHFFTISSLVTVGQSEAQGSCSRFFERLEDDLNNAIVRTKADLEVGEEKILLKLRRRLPAAKDDQPKDEEVVYRLEDPAFVRGTSSVLRNGKPIMGVTVTRMKMTLVDPGVLGVQAQLVDSRSNRTYLAEGWYEIPAIQQALLYGAYLVPLTPTPAPAATPRGRS